MTYDIIPQMYIRIFNSHIDRTGGLCVSNTWFQSSIRWHFEDTTRLHGYQLTISWYSRTVPSCTFHVLWSQCPSFGPKKRLTSTLRFVQTETSQWLLASNSRKDSIGTIVTSVASRMVVEKSLLQASMDQSKRLEWQPFAVPRQWIVSVCFLTSEKKTKTRYTLKAFFCGAKFQQVDLQNSGLWLWVVFIPCTMCFWHIDGPKGFVFDINFTWSQLSTKTCRVVGDGDVNSHSNQETFPEVEPKHCEWLLLCQTNCHLAVGSDFLHI